MPTPEPSIRDAERDDLPALLTLIERHATFEKAHFDAEAKASSLAEMFFGPAARLQCFVAVDDRSPIGYATASPVASTWDAMEYLHMDTLFVDDDYRNTGLGRRLFAAVESYAARLNIIQIQWQTPAWNTKAVRFYERLGAEASPKTRFILQTSLPS